MIQLKRGVVFKDLARNRICEVTRIKEYPPYRVETREVNPLKRFRVYYRADMKEENFQIMMVGVICNKCGRKTYTKKGKNLKVVNISSCVKCR